MKLSALREAVRDAEPTLAEHPFVVIATFETRAGALQLCLTERLRKRARKAGAWNRPALYSALKNASYGFDEARARSRGGADGLFLLDRSFRPENAMMRKLFAGYLDKPRDGAEEVASALDVPLASLLPVRLVSHHLRLLGMLARRDDADWLVLVDLDSE